MICNLDIEPRRRGERVFVESNARRHDSEIEPQSRWDEVYPSLAQSPAYVSHSKELLASIEPLDHLLR